jgi:hypothetical protein
VRPDLRELPFGELRKPVVELAGNGQFEDAVPEELEALVGRRAVGRPGRVREDVVQALRRELGNQALE